MIEPTGDNPRLWIAPCDELRQYAQETARGLAPRRRLPTVFHVSILTTEQTDDPHEEGHRAELEVTGEAYLSYSNYIDLTGLITLETTLGVYTPSVRCHVRVPTNGSRSQLTLFLD